MFQMETNKVRIDELTLLYFAVEGLVEFPYLDPEREMATPNLGYIFAEQLVSLKTKPFKGTGTSKGEKKETVGSLLTPIFQYLGVRLDAAEAPTTRTYMDVCHLSSAQWLKSSRYWNFRMGNRIRLIALPAPHVTDFEASIDRPRFEPDEAFLRDP